MHEREGAERDAADLDELLSARANLVERSTGLVGRARVGTIPGGNALLHL